MSILHFAHESSNIQHQGYSTMGNMPTKNETDASGIMSHLDDFQIIPFENFNKYNSPYIFPEMNFTFFQRNW